MAQIQSFRPDMAFVTEDLQMQNLAANLLTAVFQGPALMISEARAIELRGWDGKGGSEEWEVLAAVATSLRQSAKNEGQASREAEIHLLRHLATRHEQRLGY